MTESLELMRPEKLLKELISVKNIFTKSSVMPLTKKQKTSTGESLSFCPNLYDDKFGSKRSNF